MIVLYHSIMGSQKICIFSFLHYYHYLLKLLFFCCLSFYLHTFFVCKGQGYNSIIPTVPDDVSGDSHDPTKKLANKVAAYLEQYIEAMEKVFNPYF
jgi:hypothetical protein